MNQDQMEMEKLKAEWNRSLRGARAHAWSLSSLKRFFRAVLSDVVSGIVMLSALGLGVAMVFGAFKYTLDTGHGRLAILAVLLATLPIRAAWRFVIWWRHRTGRS